MRLSRIFGLKRLAGLIVLGACAAPQIAPATPPCVAAARTLPGGYCADATAEARAAILDRLPRPLSVDPVQHEILAGKFPARSTLVGAAIVLPAPESMSPAWLQRVLTCHEADVALGQIQAQRDDPFCNPSAWLGIAAYPHRGTLVIRIEPSDESQAASVLAQATRWASRFTTTP